MAEWQPRTRRDRGEATPFRCRCRRLVTPAMAVELEDGTDLCDACFIRERRAGQIDLARLAERQGADPTEVARVADVERRRRGGRG